MSHHNLDHKDELTLHPDYLSLDNQSVTQENIALFTAASNGEFDKVKSLLSKGAKPNFFHRPEDQKNALHVSAEHGYLDIVKLLLQHGAIVDSVAAKEQTTALILAASNPKNPNIPAVLQALIEAGADINFTNGYGNSALHEAAHSGNLKNVIVLINAGAMVNLENHKGSTPLHMFCYGEDIASHPLSVAEKLIEAGADVNAPDHRGSTPILVCATTGRVDLVELLVHHGGKLLVKDNTGHNAEDIAVFYRQGDMVQYLHSTLSKK